MSKSKFPILAVSLFALGAVSAQPNQPANQMPPTVPVQQPQQPQQPQQAGITPSSVNDGSSRSVGNNEGHSPAVSVDDLLRSGQLRREQSRQDPLPTPMSGLAPNGQVGVGLPTPSDKRSNEISLVAVYLSGSVRMAQVQLDGSRQLAVVGDRLKGGWIVKAVARQAVDIERCNKGACSTKTLYLGDD